MMVGDFDGGGKLAGERIKISIREGGKWGLEKGRVVEGLEKLRMVGSSCDGGKGI